MGQDNIDFKRKAEEIRTFIYDISESPEKYPNVNNHCQLLDVMYDKTGVRFSIDIGDKVIDNFDHISSDIFNLYLNNREQLYLLNIMLGCSMSGDSSNKEDNISKVEEDLIYRVKSGYIDEYTMKRLLGEAIEHNLIKLVVELLNKGIIPGYYDLLKPIKSGNIELVKLLVNSGGNINVTSDEILGCNLDWHLLYYAISNNDLKMVKELISLGADVNMICEHGTNALHRAVDRQNLQIIKEIVNAGVNINVRDSEGRTPLDVVKQGMGKIEVIEFLISIGAE